METCALNTWITLDRIHLDLDWMFPIAQLLWAIQGNPNSNRAIHAQFGNVLKKYHLQIPHPRAQPGQNLLVTWSDALSQLHQLLLSQQDPTGSRDSLNFLGPSTLWMCSWCTQAVGGPSCPCVRPFSNPKRDVRETFGLRSGRFIRMPKRRDAT